MQELCDSGGGSGTFKGPALGDADHATMTVLSEVLFGGRASLYFNDTWKWQGGAWAQISTPVAPSAREDAMMAYDPTDGYVLMFGGENQANHLLNDTWTFVGGAWTNITASVRIRSTG